MGLRRAGALLVLLVLTPLLHAGPATATAEARRDAGQPEIRGSARQVREGAVLRARPARLTVDPAAPPTVERRWLRDDEPVPGETGLRYRTGADDVGHRLRVTELVTSAGVTTTLTSRAVRVTYRRPVRRTVTYSVETRGPVTADVAEFARLAQETYDDPRGWRAAGIAFRQVARGGSFTLVLATPEQLPRFSSVCSSSWSCRAGRYVVINQRRWLHASPAWNGAGGSLRDYRHLVVDHETGHWLGLGHSGCPHAGAPAPVMMQQSKGLGGCRFNPFPTPAELGRV